MCNMIFLRRMHMHPFLLILLYHTVKRSLHLKQMDIKAAFLKFLWVHAAWVCFCAGYGQPYAKQDSLLNGLKQATAEYYANSARTHYVI